MSSQILIFTNLQESFQFFKVKLREVKKLAITTKPSNPGLSLFSNPSAFSFQCYLAACVFIPTSRWWRPMQGASVPGGQAPAKPGCHTSSDGRKGLWEQQVVQEPRFHVYIRGDLTSALHPSLGYLDSKTQIWKHIWKYLINFKIPYALWLLQPCSVFPAFI